MNWGEVLEFLKGIEADDPVLKDPVRVFDDGYFPVVLFGNVNGSGLVFLPTEADEEEQPEG